MKFLLLWKQFQNQLRGYGKCIQLLFPSCWKAYKSEIVLEFTSTKNFLLIHGFMSQNPIFIPSKRVLIKEMNDDVIKNEMKYSTKFSRLQQYSQKKAIAALDVIAVKKKVIEVSAGASMYFFKEAFNISLYLKVLAKY